MLVASIIENLYNSSDLNDCIRKMVRPHHRQDFKQELFLILYEKPHETIISLHKSNGLKYYVVRIILNLVNQKRNVYHKKYNDNSVVYDTEVLNHISYDQESFEERDLIEQKEMAMVEEVNNLDKTFDTPYYRMLVNLVNEHGSQRAVSRLTGIPVSSICEAVKKVRNHLNSIYNGDPIKGIY